jgi:hypothetical protein
MHAAKPALAIEHATRAVISLFHPGQQSCGMHTADLCLAPTLGSGDGAPTFE